jgi:hypothetical protein
MTDASKSNTYTPVGVSGLTSYGGRIYEEYLTELQGWRWRRVLADMTTGDPDIGAILFAIQMLIRQVSWPLVPYSAPDEQATPEDIDTARYVESCLPDMRETWPLTLSEILSFLPWGHAELEVIFKLRQGEVRRKDGSIDRLKSSKYDDGKIGWGAWAIRSQDTLDHWEWDENGDPVAFVQIAPPNYIPTSIPLSKCLHFVTMGRKGNPEGFSMLRTAYRAWFFKRKIENLEGVGFERDLAGLVVAKVPPELLDTLNRSPEQAAVYAAVESIVRNIHRDEQEGVVWPQAYDENGHLLYDLTLLTTGGTRQFSTDTAINRYSTKIAMSVMADFIILGHENVGSFALASSKTSLFATALGAWMDTICAVINTQAIPQLLRLNGLDPSRAPTLTHGDIESIDLSALGAYLDALSKAGAPLFANDSENILYKHLLEQAGLPVPAAQAVTKDEGMLGQKRPADVNAPPNVPAQQANEPKRGSARASADLDALIEAEFAAALGIAQEVVG